MARKALVTGGNRGIGRAIAAGLVDAGLDVTITARNPAAARPLAEDLGVDVIQMDLLDDSSIYAAIDGLGPVDVLVNNAGILRDDPLFEDESGFRNSLQVMVTAPYLLMASIAPGMADRGYGRIVNLSSGWGSFAEGLGPGSYGIAKAALNALTVRAAAELPASVKVNAVCPGHVRTDMGGPNAPRSPEQGAATAVWLATLSDKGPTGGFFRDRKAVAW